MQTFVDQAGEEIRISLSKRIPCLIMLKDFAITAEDWFRLEILDALSRTSVQLVSTNRPIDKSGERPDLVVKVNGKRRVIELKVLPKCGSYDYGWQRFQSGENNKRDFEYLESGKRHGVIYIYWGHPDDWNSTKCNLAKKYSVSCFHEDTISIGGKGEVWVSYWATR